MPVPTGIPTEEVLRIIERVVGPLSIKFKFGSYDVEEIKQEATIIAWEAIVKSYDENRPLENFLRVHVRNRLLNFKRNNSRGLIGGKPEIIENNNIEINDIKNKIDENLPGELRQDYLRMTQGISIPAYRREKLLETIREILGIDTKEEDS